MGNRNQLLKYEIKEGVVNISIGADLLVHAVTHGWRWSEDWTVTDKDLFVKAIVEAMQNEQEDGSHPIHSVFDTAAETAMEYGTSIDPETFSKIVEG